MFQPILRLIHERSSYPLSVRILPDAHNRNFGGCWIVLLNAQKSYHFTYFTRQKRGEVVNISRILNNRFFNPEPCWLGTQDRLTNFSLAKTWPINSESLRLG
jgi:hypothetical protein